MNWIEAIPDERGIGNSRSSVLREEDFQKALNEGRGAHIYLISVAVWMTGRI